MGRCGRLEKDDGGNRTSFTQTQAVLTFSKTLCSGRGISSPSQTLPINEIVTVMEKAGAGTYLGRWSSADVQEGNIGRSKWARCRGDARGRRVLVTTPAGWIGLMKTATAVVGVRSSRTV